MNKKYQIILADPPWKQSKGGKKSIRPNSSGGELDYKTISLSEINQLLIKAKHRSESSHCFFVWTIDKFLHETEEMMYRSGYKLHARMIWNKVTGIPAAFTIRYGHEYLLWFYYGKLLPVQKEERGKIHSVFTEQVKRHSQKPEISYSIIERLYPEQKKLEMFSRYERIGWDAFGNEAVNSIIL
jgi:N6-adenosine-specific RNA methylase IME4